jgi:hypothetical protein
MTQARTSLRGSFVVSLAWALTACSSAHPAAAGPASFPADAYTTTTSDTGTLLIDVRTSPQPPSVGTNEIQLSVTKASDGSPVDGLTLDVEPWMPSMGHGTSSPGVTPQGSGVYLVTDVYLYMQGVWTLRTTISGAMSDHAKPQLDIQ